MRKRTRSKRVDRSPGSVAPESSREPRAARTPAAPARTVTHSAAVRALESSIGNRATERVLARATAGTTLVPRARPAAAPRRGDAAQRPSLQRATDYNALNGSTITATVADNANPITMTGTYRVSSLVVGNIAASLDYAAVTIPRAAVSTSIFAFGNVSALEITNVTAAPGGQRIGQILAWHLARVARGQGVDYVSAGNVRAARGPFYTPLGFVDFHNAPSWASLVARKAVLEGQLAAPGVPAPAIVNEYHQVNAAMAANKIFIPTATLEANARAAWWTHWRPA